VTILFQGRMLFLHPFHPPRWIKDAGELEDVPISEQMAEQLCRDAAEQLVRDAANVRRTKNLDVPLTPTRTSSKVSPMFHRRKPEIRHR
jgi:hypothetical protein